MPSQFTTSNTKDMEENFKAYMNQYRTGRESEFTHTSINPGGRYYISGLMEDDFFEMYKIAMKSGMVLTMTERHRDICPVLIDMDFRKSSVEPPNPITVDPTSVDNPTETELTIATQPPDSTSSVKNHFYTMEHIHKILDIYMKTLSTYVCCDDVDIYLLEKSSYREEKGVYKDGFHVVIPGIVTKPSVQLLARNKVLQDLQSVVDDMNLCNKIEDIFDKCVIDTNNWQMLGSTKPDCEAYKITHIYKYHGKEDSLEKKFEEQPIHADQTRYIKNLSIRNKHIETTILDERLEEVKQHVDQLESDKLAHRIRSNIVQMSKNTALNESHDLEFIQKLVSCLSPTRAEKYDEWIRLGWCLRTLDHRLLDTWDGFSRNGSKFKEGECANMWNCMRSNGLGIGSLCMWAKHDNLKKYEEVVANDLTCLFKKIAVKNPTDTDFGMILKRMYYHQFRCTSTARRTWYHFRNHRWVSCDDGYPLRKLMSTDVFVKIIQYSQTVQGQATLEGGQDADSSQAKILLEQVGHLNKAALSLKCQTKKQILMKECADLFMEEKFEEKLDSNCSLLCFENGVYDLELQEFREGRPEDYVSFTTGINYEPYDPENPFNHDLMDFFCKVLPNQEVREYVFGIFASALDGNVREERFNIWTGSGSNGKSCCLDLFERCVGEYSCKFNVSLLTSKRVSSNSTNSEIVRAKGKRFAVLQEPSENEKLNVGIMKELTGGDRIIARGLFKEPIEFKPMFKMVLACNHLPEVPSDDGGTWRRIRVVEFGSKFCHNPQASNEYMIDTDLSSKFDQWKQPFMSLLVEKYKEYKIKMPKEPEEVMKCTKEYQMANDFIAEFVDEQLIKKDGSMIDTTTLLKEYRAWATDKGGSKRLKKKELETYLEKKMSCLGGTDKNKRYMMGYTFSSFVQGDEEQDNN
jgi:P4 family phage/plasmid primase-like protien